MAIEQRNYSRYLLIKVIVVENNIATFKCCQFEPVEDCVEAFCYVEVNVLCYILRLMYYSLLFYLLDVFLYFSQGREILFSFISVVIHLENQEQASEWVCVHMCAGGVRGWGRERRKRETGREALIGRDHRLSYKKLSVWNCAVSAECMVVHRQSTGSEWNVMRVSSQRWEIWRGQPCITCRESSRPHSHSALPGCLKVPGPCIFLDISRSISCSFPFLSFQIVNRSLSEGLFQAILSVLVS